MGQMQRLTSPPPPLWHYFRFVFKGLISGPATVVRGQKRQVVGTKERQEGFQFSPDTQIQTTWIWQRFTVGKKTPNKQKTIGKVNFPSCETLR